VVYELGLFQATLGANKVITLKKGNIEIPSDYTGVVYIPWEGEWQIQLMRELKAAGVPIDANRLFGN
jgi:predicted nucleotide-binding protein